MSKRYAKSQFNGGELSPWLKGRVDIAKFNQTAQLCRNFLPLTEGCIKRRGGTRFVACALEDTAVLFEIQAVPLEASILINNVLQNSIYIARGDVVHYSVKCDGYASVSGKACVISDTTLNIVLVSSFETCTLTIVPTPSDAIVKINDYERLVYSGHKNEMVSYVVYKDGYKLFSESVLLDEDKTINVTLEADSGESANYGDWGNPLAFISCTQYGYTDAFYKCFLFRFENGYLPILFDANKEAPSASDFNESLFVYTNDDGYDSFVLAHGTTQQLAVIGYNNYYISYKDLDNTLLAAFDYATMMFYGWPLDEYGKYASIYRSYDGNVVGRTVKVYAKGNLVYELKGRNNG